MELKKAQNDIIQVDMLFNLIVLIVGALLPKLWLFYTALSVNLILLGSYMIITKYFFMIAGITMANKFAKKVNNQLEVLNGQIPREV